MKSKHKFFNAHTSIKLSIKIKQIEKSQLYQKNSTVYYKFVSHNFTFIPIVYCYMHKENKKLK